MRHLLLYMAFFATAIVCWSCDVETSSNGDLDGYWHLERIDTIGGSGTGACDYRDKQVFWSFQNGLAQMSGLGGNPVVCRMEYGDGRIMLSTPCLFDRTAGDSLLTDAALLRPYGINRLSETFVVVGLSSERLTLEAMQEALLPQLRLTFRRY